MEAVREEQETLKAMAADLGKQTATCGELKQRVPFNELPIEGKIERIREIVKSWRMEFDSTREHLFAVDHENRILRAQLMKHQHQPCTGEALIPLSVVDHPKDYHFGRDTSSDADPAKAYF